MARQSRAPTRAPVRVGAAHRGSRARRGIGTCCSRLAGVPGPVASTESPTRRARDPRRAAPQHFCSRAPRGPASARGASDHYPLEQHPIELGARTPRMTNTRSSLLRTMGLFARGVWRRRHGRRGYLWHRRRRRRLCHPARLQHRLPVLPDRPDGHSLGAHLDGHVDQRLHQKRPRPDDRATGSRHARLAVVPGGPVIPGGPDPGQLLGHPPIDVGEPPVHRRGSRRPPLHHRDRRQPLGQRRLSADPQSHLRRRWRAAPSWPGGRHAPGRRRC